MIEIGNKRVRRRDKRIWYLVGGVFVAVFLFTFLTHTFKNRAEEVEAANLAAFDPGYIISDYQMSNYNSMNESQIQSFLYSKNSCNDTNLSRYTVGEKVNYFSETSPPRTWHIKDGHFVCMADEVFDGGTAAHIIYQAAQDYRINPQVLLVLLEKEQSLVRDTFPHSQQYRSATGYGCPDTAACSSKYYGLKNQIENAAALFRTVLDGGWTNYPLGNNYVQYNPNANCGGSVVNIRNLATSSLYRYTPYQPNATTLAGGSDSCSAYGNMNFYSFFQDWFGGITQEQKSTKIVEGVYYIQSASVNKMALDVDSGLDENGTNIQLYTKNETEAQQWEITYNSDTDDYNIINVASEKSLDVAGAGINNGTNIQLWETNQSCAQRWKIVEVAGEAVKFVSACSNRVLDVSGGKMENGRNIQLWSDNGTSAQQWILVPVEVVEDGLYNISSAIINNKIIDISGGIYNAKNGTNVQIYKDNKTTAQRWYIERDDNGYYTIKNKQSGKVLDIIGGSTSNGANVRIYDYNKTCAQKWRIMKSDEKYTFISACSHKVLDLAGGNTQNGTNIQIYHPNNTVAQKWILSPISMIEPDTYNIVSKLADDKVIDIANGSKYNGANIQLYKNNETEAQQWKIIYDDKTDYYTFFNESANKAIDVDSAGKVSGANVQIYSKNTTCAQKWAIVEDEEGYYIIYSACSGLVLDVAGGSTQNNTNIWLYKNNNTNAQRWTFK